jgi:ssDNA-binding Zn-finger/Zn-ribbon topoisomerase 1
MTIIYPKWTINLNEDAYVVNRSMMNCPRCGKDMEHGYIRAESFIGGIKWMREKSTKSLGLETVAKPDMLGFVFIEGFRCPECRLICSQY